MKKPQIIFAALAIVLLTGCGPRRIDGSSEEAFKKSLESMSKGLSDEQRKELTEGVMALGMDGVNIFQIGAAPGVMEQRMRDNLNGKTFAEIQAAVAALQQERALVQARREKEEAAREAARAEERAKAASKKKAQIESEIAELEAEKAKAVQAASTLAKFQVLRSRFYYSESSYRSSPTIELTVKNGLPGSVSRVYFSAVLSSPGRSVPWVNDSFNYSVSGGLEPGEEATWKLEPNMFGEWSRAPKDRQDMILTLKLIKVDGANGEAMYDSVFRESKQSRLDKLKDALAKGDFSPSFFD